jgi:fatty acyl-CoA reductase
VDRYDVALNINTLGPQRLLNFAHRCPNLQLFMHVSTAYVNGQRQGLTPEMPFYMNRSIAQEMGSNPPNLNVLSEISLAKTKLQDLEAEVYTGSHTVDPAKEQSVKRKMQQLGMKRAQMFGWQDTYVFTKAMGEMLLLSSQKNTVPVVIIRPSVVESTLEDPFPGWIEGIR